MKRALAGLLATLLLAACGNSGTAPASSSAPAASTATSAAPAAAPPAAATPAAAANGNATPSAGESLDIQAADKDKNETALERAVGHDVVVADYSLPDGTSLDILPQVKKLNEETPFVILTAHGSIDLAVVEVHVDGDHAVVELRATSTLRSGEPFDNRYCWVCTFADDTIVAVRAYLDSALVAATLAALEAPS